MSLIGAKHTASLEDWPNEDLYLPELLPFARDVERVMPFSILASLFQRDQNLNLRR